MNLDTIGRVQNKTPSSVNLWAKSFWMEAHRRARYSELSRPARSAMRTSSDRLPDFIFVMTFAR
jgi:hypothetical protein